MADILRDLADLLDQKQDDQADQEQGVEPVEVDRTDKDEVDSGHFIPPLQQKLELLKKAVGVQSAYDQDSNGVPDELDAIKKNAGINPAVVQIASDDEPLDH